MAIVLQNRATLQGRLVLLQAGCATLQAGCFYFFAARPAIVAASQTRDAARSDVVVLILPLQMYNINEHN